MTFRSSSGHKNTLICLCISGSIAVGAAPESFAFPAVNLAALIVTARTVLWQTSAGTRHRSCLLKGETASQRQQEADSGVSTCSLPCPALLGLSSSFLQRSLCEEGSCPPPLWRSYWKELDLSEVTFMELKGHVTRPQSLWRRFFLCSLLTNGCYYMVLTSDARCCVRHSRMCICFLCGTVQALFNGCTVCTSGLLLDDGIFLFYLEEI